MTKNEKNIEKKNNFFNHQGTRSKRNLGQFRGLAGTRKSDAQKRAKMPPPAPFSVRCEIETVGMALVPKGWDGFGKRTFALIGCFRSHFGSSSRFRTCCTCIFKHRYLFAKSIPQYPHPVTHSIIAYIFQPIMMRVAISILALFALCAAFSTADASILRRSRAIDHDKSMKTLQSMSDSEGQDEERVDEKHDEPADEDEEVGLMMSQLKAKRTKKLVRRSLMMSQLNGKRSLKKKGKKVQKAKESDRQHHHITAHSHQHTKKLMRRQVSHMCMLWDDDCHARQAWAQQDKKQAQEDKNRRSWMQFAITTAHAGFQSTATAKAIAAVKQVITAEKKKILGIHIKCCYVPFSHTPRRAPRIAVATDDSACSTFNEMTRSVRPQESERVKCSIMRLHL